MSEKSVEWERTRRRLPAARMMGKLLLNPEFRKVISNAGGLDNACIVMVEDDTMSYLLGRLAVHPDGASVIVGQGETLTVITITRSTQFNQGG